MIGKSSRYFETAELIDEAFLELVQEKDLELITVKEICARAGVSRSTFYLHYDTIADLLEESASLVLRRFFNRFDEGAPKRVLDQIRSCPAEELCLMIPEYLVPYLEFVRDNKRLFSAFVENPGGLRMLEAYSSMERHVIFPILDRFGVAPTERPYLMAFYLNGLLAVIEEWIRGNCEEPIERVSGIMQRCCAPGAKQRSGAPARERAPEPAPEAAS